MSSSAAPPQVVAVVGPTAAGKSDLGVALARRLGGEVINVDSMQLYRGMDIGTAKLGEAERQGVPHRLLDIWDVTVTASVAEYQRLARAEIDRLLAAGRTPVLVGGSGLYVRAAVDVLDFPGTDPAVRARLEAELESAGSAVLHARLAAADPGAAEAILPGNGRRIVRALEVIEITGQPFTARLPGPDEDQSFYPTLHIGVDVARPELSERIAARVDRMWRSGLIEEVRELEEAGLREGRTASRALGYQQLLAALAGECTFDEAREQTVRATRRFARRQDVWFRRDGRVHWLSGAAADSDRLVDDAWRLLERTVTS